MESMPISKCTPLKMMDSTTPVIWPEIWGTIFTSSGRTTTSTCSSFSKPLSTQTNSAPPNSTRKSRRMMPGKMFDSPMKLATKALMGSL